MLKNPPPAELSVFLARDAPLAVILCRRPAKWVRMILWHTDRDVFEYGQWLYARVDERKCDLSPDGALFLYFAQRSGPPPAADRVGSTWTAISRPPYFTALALWPNDDSTDAGGGWFRGPREFGLHVFRQTVRATPLPAGVSSNATWDSDMPQRFGEISHYRRQRDGWRMTEQWTHHEQRVARWWSEEENLPWRRMSDPRAWERTCPRMTGLTLIHRLDLNACHGCSGVLATWGVRFPGVSLPVVLTDTEWADWDQRGRLVFTRSGRLYVVDCDALAQSGPDAARQLAEFNDMQHEPIEPPVWARDWPPSPTP